MNRAFSVVVVALVGLLVVGCAKKGTDVPMSAGVTDVSAAPAPTYTPPPQPVAQPVVYDSAPAINTQAGSIGGGSYTVKKGDTLYGIARTRYGDGKQWQKIASANPGLRPETLKVGQTITIP